MKTLVFLVLSCASLCGADNASTNASDTTARIVERDLAGGKRHLHMETVYRNGKRILCKLRTTEEGVSKVSRSYEVGGDIAMIENDEDGDGTFETFSVFRSGTKDMEMFARRPDGSVTPVSARTLEATKKQLATIDDVSEKFFQKDGLTDEQLARLIEETRKKIQETEKEKVDEKK